MTTWIVALNLVLGVWGFATQAARATPEPPAAPRQARLAPRADGDFAATFFERAPQSSFRVLAGRFGWDAEAETTDYELARESFSVYVPAGYRADSSATCGSAAVPPPETSAAGPPPAAAGYGLMVWISPTGSGAVPPGWRAVLDRHRLLWAGADQAGNRRPVQWHRFGLALDAAHNMTRHFSLDARRIYVAGFSGGARAASHLAPCYPDLFAGGLYVCGCNYYRRLPIPGRPADAYEPYFRRPPLEFFARARKHSRFVLLTGEHDFNRRQTRSTFQNGYRRDIFRYVTYLEVPGMGHDVPDAAWFERAVRALDAPLAEAP